VSKIYSFAEKYELNPDEEIYLGILVSSLNDEIANGLHTAKGFCWGEFVRRCKLAFRTMGRAFCLSFFSEQLGPSRAGKLWCAYEEIEKLLLP